MNFAKRHREENSSGSNENGEWAKFDNGVLICRKNGINALAGMTSITVTLPCTFIDKDCTVIPVNAYANSATIHWNGVGIANDTIVLYPRKSDGSVIDKEERCNYVAIRSLEINIKSLLKMKNAIQKKT